MTEFLARRREEALRPLRRISLDGLAKGRGFWAIVVGIAVLAAALRIPGLGARSLWLDEAYSAWFAALPLRELWTDAPLYETHPPLYYTLLKGWTMLFGDSEAALRAPSVVASVAMVCLVSLSGRILRGGIDADLAALFAALLLATNKGSIFFAHEARPYAIESLTVLIAILNALRLLQCLASNGTDMRASFLPPATALGLSGGMTLWMHNTAAFITLGLWVGIVLAVITVLPGRKPRNLAVVFFSGLLALAVWSPFLPMLVAQMNGVQSMEFWVRPATSDIWTAWQLAAGGQMPFAPVMGAAILGLVCLWRRNTAMAMTMAAVLVLPLYMVVAAGYVFRPIYISRLFEWMAAPLLMLSGIGVVMGSSAGPFRAALAASTVILTSLSTIPVYGYEDWRGLVARIAEESRPGDLLVALPPETDPAISYYARHHPAFPPAIYVPGRFPFRAPDRVYIGNLGAPKVEAEDIASLRRRPTSARRIWLVSRRDDLYDPGHMTEQAVAEGRREIARLAAGPITIALFE